MNKNNTKDSDRSLPKTDRRKFLKGAATSAAALAISPTAKAQDPSAYNASYTAPS